MTLQTQPAVVVDLLSAVPLLLLALWLARRRPRRAGITGLAMLSGGFGALAIATNLATLDDPLGLPLAVLTVASLTVIAVALLLMIRHFPRPLGPDDRGRVRSAFAVGLVGTAAGIVALPFLPDAFIGFDLAPPAVRAVLWVGNAAGVAVGVLYITLVLLLPLRAMDPATPPAALRQDALVASALALMSGYNQGYWLLAPDAFSYLGALTTVAAFVIAAVLWLRAGSRRARRESRLCRNTALLFLGIPAGAMALTVALGGYEASAYGPFGIVRTLAVLLLAYAILRHQLLGIDLKVRWTIKQSTLAAAFIGVFFVVSEGAQQVFSESLGPFVGIAAAGALVFAMAPLQRVAERVAVAAVPGGEAAHPASHRDEAFKAAVRLALRDRVVTPREERDLAVLADELRIGHARALELRSEAEQELAQADDRPRTRSRSGQTGP